VAPPVLGQGGNPTGDPKKKVERPPTGAPPTIKELSFRPAVAWLGDKATISGSLAFDDADGDVKALGVETRAPAGRSRTHPSIPMRLAGAKSGTAAFTFIFDPGETGTHVFDIWAIDRGGNASRRLSGSIEVMEREKPEKPEKPEPDQTPAAAGDAGPTEPAKPPAKPAKPTKAAKPASSPAKP
jgi:hypothetical protein